MTQQFFEQIEGLGLQSGIILTIQKGTENNLIVSLYLDNDKVGDEAKKVVQPMILKGTAAELDEGFFTSIATPVKKADALFVNMEAHAKSMEQARLASKMEQEKLDKEKKEKDERKKKYEEKMKKVVELEEKAKWGEAIGAMPKAEQFPEQAEDIKKKTEELRKRHGQLSLLD